MSAITYEGGAMEKYHDLEHVIYLSVAFFVAAVILAGAVMIPRGVFH
jgi:hypothetical protein